MAEAFEQRPHQGGLAGSQVAFQVDHHPRLQDRSEHFPETLGGCLVRQVENGGNIGMMQDRDSQIDYSALAEKIKALGSSLGFAAVGISKGDVSAAAPRLQEWLARGRHGEMDYMARHAPLRSNPQALVPGTLTVISTAIDYLPAAADAHETLADGRLAYVSRYALGRDYHKVVRNRLQKLAQAIADTIGPFGYRVFSDSAPVMEVEFAGQAGLGWRGKHTLLLSRQGSWRFLGDIYTDLPLPADPPAEDHCGKCTACLGACPTGAIVAPYEVDARLCISYLTIELAGPIPEELRPLVGNRIYGCDDCQLCCPWNRFARLGDPDFGVRNGLDAAGLIELFAWTETEFDDRLAGSPIRRIGHERWLRNIAVALGNAPPSEDVVQALKSRADHPSPLVREHVAWALNRQLG
jgi:epoxyqueuosine reductase